MTAVNRQKTEGTERRRIIREACRRCFDDLRLRRWEEFGQICQEDRPESGTVGRNIEVRSLSGGISSLKQVDRHKTFFRPGSGGQSKETLAVPDPNLSDVAKSAATFLLPQRLDHGQTGRWRQPALNVIERVKIIQGFSHSSE